MEEERHTPDADQPAVNISGKKTGAFAILKKKSRSKGDPKKRKKKRSLLPLRGEEGSAKRAGGWLCV